MKDYHLYYVTFPCQGCGKQQEYRDVQYRNVPGYCKTCMPLWKVKRSSKEGACSPWPPKEQAKRQKAA